LHPYFVHWPIWDSLMRDALKVVGKAGKLSLVCFFFPVSAGVDRELHAIDYDPLFELLDKGM